MNRKRLLAAVVLLFISCIRLIAQSPCAVNPNLDFEMNNYSFWQYANSSSSSTAPVPGLHTITSGSGTDFYTGVPVVDPLGGAHSFKLGDDIPSAQSQTIRYYMNVPAGGPTKMAYRYAAVLQDGGHPDGEQAKLMVTVRNITTGTYISCACMSLAPRDAGLLPSPMGVWYNPWTTAVIDLTGHGGSTVMVEFTTIDCIWGGHFGYAYIDLGCVFPADTQVITHCCPSPAPLGAPAGFQSYYWYQVPNFSTVIATGQTTTGPCTPGLYACVMRPYNGGCFDTFYVRIKTETPEAGIVICPSSMCAASPFSYTCSVTGNNIGGYWSLTGGGSDVTIDPTYGWLTINPNITTPKTVTACYRVSNTCGSDEACCTFTVYPNPKFTFTGAATGTYCSGIPFTLGVALTPPYSAPGHTYAWSVGGTAPSITQTRSTCWGYAALFTATVTNTWGCKTSQTTHVNIDAKPCAGTITCPGNLCASTPVSYFFNAVGNNGPGVWSLTGGGGDVTVDPTYGLLAIDPDMTTPRACTVTFTVTNPCGSESTSCTFNVYPDPKFTVTKPANGCSGIPFTMAVSFTWPYSSSGATHTYAWSNGATTQTMTDVRSGVSYTWIYGLTVTNNWGCSTFQNPSITVYQPEKTRIETCPPPLCVGQSATVWGYMSGVSSFTGTWTWSPASVLSAVTTTASSIVITGASAGTATLTYSSTNSATGCSDYAICIVTVNPSPGAITGPTLACVGNTLTLSGSPAGGTWTSGNTLRATVNSAGEVTGVAPGTVSIGYSFGGTCSASYIITVNPSPTPVIKECVHELCVGNSATILGDPAYATGYTISWTATPPSGGPITLTPMGNDAIVTGNVPGGATISYTITDANGCSGTAVCVVNVHPAPMPISGPSDVCQNQVITLTGTPGGGTWVSANTAIATVGTAGDVMGVSGGTVVIDYMVPGPGSCYSEMTVNVIPKATACVQWAFDPDCGCNAFIFNGTPGASVNYNVLDCFGTSLGMMSLSLDGSGYAPVLLSSLPSGACRICVVTVEYMGCKWPCNCVASPLGKCCAVAGAPRGMATTALGIEEETHTHAHIDIIPNPNRGEFTISGIMPSDRDVTVEIVDVLGQVVYSAPLKVKNKAINQAITLDGTLANGMYLIKISNAEVNEVLRFALRR